MHGWVLCIYVCVWMFACLWVGGWAIDVHPDIVLLCAHSRQRDRSKQTDGTPVALWNFFVERVREQLHVVLAMSPIGDAFRARIRMFPSLVNCCTIDWFMVRIMNKKHQHPESVNKLLRDIHLCLHF